MSQNPVVSVIMITYGHENYIRQAIGGVLMQKCDFEVELIVANDCSPDNTDYIINDIIQNHPQGKWIIYHNHPKNLGMMPNFIKTLQEAKGKYIALCEGDDFWIDSNKLQTQIKFLELNPQYVLTYHNANIVNSEGEFIQESCMENINKKDFTAEGLKKGANIITSSMVFVNSLEFPKEFGNVLNGDTFLISMLGNYGVGKYFDLIMSNYRFHNGGIWSQRNKYERIYPQINTYSKLMNYYKTKDDFEIVKFFESERFESGLKLFEESWNKNVRTVLKTYIFVFFTCGVYKNLNFFKNLNRLIWPKIKKKLKNLIKGITLYFDSFVSKLIIEKQKKDYTKIPIVIINFNQLTCFKELLNFLYDCNFKNIIVIDNNSTYEPLLEFYELNKRNVKIYRLSKNYGHMVFWKKKDIFKKYTLGYHVVTDSDILPTNECPKEFIKYFKKILDFNPQLTKVGFNLKIDDIPDTNLNKEKILKWESKFWSETDVEGNYIAPIDTTFALYRPNYKFSYNTFYKSIRTKNPYQCRHLSWYIDNKNLTQEQKYYYRTCNNSTSWKLNEEGDIFNSSIYDQC